MYRQLMRAGFAAALAVSIAPAFAAQRTFVSPDGNDANACSISAPCRSFSAALAHTDPQGEIVVLGSAGYGPVAISQPVKIIAPPGVYAGISVISGTGVNIFALAASDVVTLRGLTINSQGGSYGVVLAANVAGKVFLEDCTIDGMITDGIRHYGTGPLYLSGVVVTNSGGNGIYVTGGATASRATIERSRFEHNQVGIRVEYASVSVKGSLATGNGTGMVAGGPLDGVLDIESSVTSHNLVGVQGLGAAGHAFISIANSSITQNAVAGVTGGPSDVIRVSNSTIIGNVSGVAPAVVSLGGNALVGNGSGNAFVPPPVAKQ